MSRLAQWTQGNDLSLDIARHVDEPCHHCALALTGSLNIVENARLACQDRLSVRAAAHTVTVLLYIITEATQNEKVS